MSGDAPTCAARMRRASSRTASFHPSRCWARVPVRPRYGRGPALPEPHARVPAASARAGTRAGTQARSG